MCGSVAADSEEFEVDGRQPHAVAIFRHFPWPINSHETEAAGYTRVQAASVSLPVLIAL